MATTLEIIEQHMDRLAGNLYPLGGTVILYLHEAPFNYKERRRVLAVVIARKEYWPLYLVEITFNIIEIYNARTKI